MNNNPSGFNLFREQNGGFNILMNMRNTVNGVPVKSPMVQSRQNITPLSANGTFVNGSIGSLQIGSLIANQITGGTIQGTEIFVGSKFGVDSSGNVIGNSFNFTGGTMANWQVSSGTVASPNGNIVLDGNNNRIVLMKSGKTKLALQG